MKQGRSEEMKSSLCPCCCFGYGLCCRGQNSTWYFSVMPRRMSEMLVSRTW